MNERSAAAQPAQIVVAAHEFDIRQCSLDAIPARFGKHRRRDVDPNQPLESLRKRNEHASNAATKIERHVPIWGITELPASRIEHAAGAPFAAREKIAFGALRQVMHPVAFTAQHAVIWLFLPVSLP